VPMTTHTSDSGRPVVLSYTMTFRREKPAGGTGGVAVGAGVGVGLGVLFPVPPLPPEPELPVPDPPVEPPPDPAPGVLVTTGRGVRVRWQSPRHARLDDREPERGTHRSRARELFRREREAIEPQP